MLISPTTYQRFGGFRRFSLFAICIVGIIVLLNNFKDIYHIKRTLTNSASQSANENSTYMSQIFTALSNLKCPPPQVLKCPPVKTTPLPVCPVKKFNFNDNQCFRFPHGMNTTVIDLFEDIMDSPKKPTKGNSIFFVETSCATNGIFRLKPRQACSLESAALTNTNRDIFLLIATPVGFPHDEDQMPPIVKALESYENIHVRYVNLPKFVNNTPVEKWFHTGELLQSSFLHVHVSDFLRLLALYHFGGTYFDLDFFVQKNLDELPFNFFGEEVPNIIGNSAMNFDYKGIGHEMASLILQEFAYNYNGKDWSFNGPTLMGKVATRICGTANHTLQTRENCVGFEVMPRDVFFPIGTGEFWKLYTASQTQSVLERVKHSFGIHTWNAITTNSKHKKNEKGTAYTEIAKKLCPKVQRLVKDDWFWFGTN